MLLLDVISRFVNALRSLRVGPRGAVDPV